MNSQSYFCKNQDSAMICQYYIKSNNRYINILEGINIYNPKCIILHIHGLGSHFQYIYESPDEFTYRDNYFSENNIKSYAFEFYGHGKSDGDRCTIFNIDHLVEDLSAVIEFISNKESKKIILLGESLGASIILKYIYANNNDNIIGLVLLSPLCGLNDKFKSLTSNTCLTRVLSILSYLFPHCKIPFTKRTNKKETINIIEYINALDKCKYKYKDNYKLCTLNEIIKITQWIDKYVNDNITLPVLLCHGLHDDVTSCNASKKIFERLNNEHNKLVLIDTNEHGLLLKCHENDINPELIYIKIMMFINQLL